MILFIVFIYTDRQTSCQSCSTTDLVCVTQTKSVMKSQTATEHSFEVYQTVTKEIDLAYSKILLECFENNFSLNWDTFNQWCNQISFFISDLNDPVNFSENFAKKLSLIRKWLQKDKLADTNVKNQSLPLITLPSTVQIGKIAKLKLESNFETWLNSLKIVLCAEGVVEAIESLMNDDDPQNLIARGRILLSVSSKLLTQIKSYHVAYYMLQTLKEKFKI